MNNVVLTGFMGTGKSAVGQEVARRLNRPFFDMDAEIEQRTGKSIPEIFAEDGEGAFREIERAVCEELARRERLVIATGGGALVDPENRERMMEHDTVICLNAAPDAILERVGDGEERPLLDVPDPRAEVERLLDARASAYAAIPWQVDTTDRTVEAIAEEVVSIASFITTPVQYPGDSYDIHIGNGALDYLGGAVRAAGIPEGARVAVVSNPVVRPLYGDRVERSLRQAGFSPFPVSMPDGEQHKHLDTVASLYDQFLSDGLDRTGAVLALGGGVTGDTAGFAASSFMRGVPFVQVPTTLLAMVDASVGGKTGVDLPQGKNLVGAFKQPALVLIDPTVLETLALEELRSGLAEVIKHGVIAAPDLFSDLASGAHDFSAWWGERAPLWISRALKVKIDVVQEDPYEGGWRAVLNLGHTVGHAVERLSDFDLRHGEAVSIGLVAAARIAAALNRAEPTVAEQIETALVAWELPVRCPPYTIDAIWGVMEHDKKKRGKRLQWVLPLSIGRVELTQDVPREIVNQVLIEMGAQKGKES